MDRKPDHNLTENLSSSTRKDGKQVFDPTQWSIVLAAADKATPRSSEALEQLCRAYWPPVYSHLRMKGHDLHEAQDLAQEFFARLLHGPSLASVSPEKGRFRSFLLAALKHFLINEWKRERTLKRGGGVVFVNLDGIDPAVRDAYQPLSGENPETAYERRWALTLLDRVRSRMKREYEAAGQGARHDALKAYLLGGEEADSYAETATRLGLSEAATKSAIYKIRQRFAQLLRAEITRTVGSAAEVEDELRHLIASLRR
jgi:RNA polymerase sigma factor (sigma-70 family)